MTGNDDPYGLAGGPTGANTDPLRQHADLHSHYIEGFAREAMHRGQNPATAYFKVPLITHIEGHLWMGGCIHGARLPDSFKHVVSLYPWGSYELGPRTARLVVEMHDSAAVPTDKKLDELATYTLGCLKRGPTLVHCQAGLNRSGLLSALVLMRQGRTATEAIELLRERRSPLVLCNEAFANYLKGRDA